MYLATTTGDFSGYTDSQLDAVRWIAGSGFRFIDYSFGSDKRMMNGVFSSDRDGYVASLLREADRLGVRFIQSHAPMGRPLERGSSHAEFVEDNIRCIESCAALGIGCVVIHSGYEKGISKEECLERNRDFFLELLPCAERHDVTILVENFNRMCVDGLYWIDNAPDLLEMVELVDHPLFQAVWDAGHANMQEMPQDEALRILGSHVRALHVQDNMGGSDSHMAPFFGTLSLDSLMKGLSDIGYDGYFTFEACNLFLPGSSRRQFDGDTRLKSAPLPLRLKGEELLYEIGKTILSAYGRFDG
ncbi:MAG: sugar phosphate isomerase/epimerase [Clostridiales bacterium]|nr:sugar phosphate isomerase/epimerase [Clostridiales bacterium]